MLNKEVVREMVRHYQDPKVGCVAGEKRILKKENRYGPRVQERVFTGDMSRH